MTAREAGFTKIGDAGDFAWDVYERFLGAAAKRNHLAEACGARWVVPGGLAPWAERPAPSREREWRGPFYLGIDVDAGSGSSAREAGYCDVMGLPLMRPLPDLKKCSCARAEATFGGVGGKFAQTLIPDGKAPGWVGAGFCWTDQTSGARKNSDWAGMFRMDGTPWEEAAGALAQKKKKPRGNQANFRWGPDGGERSRGKAGFAEAWGGDVFDYGNTIRTLRFFQAGVKNSFTELSRDLCRRTFPTAVFARATGPFPVGPGAFFPGGRLSDIARDGSLGLEMFPAGREHLKNRWINWRRSA